METALQITELPGQLGESQLRPTVVSHDPDGMRVAWAGAQFVRTREIRAGPRRMLSVDHDPERGYWIEATDIGAALISEDGLLVRHAPDPDQLSWQAMLISQVMPTVATLRGFEVFHASAVIWNGRAQLFCGHSGVGKSSLATHLVLAGAQLLSDDVVAVDRDLVAYSGTLALSVRPAELATVLTSSVGRLRQIGEFDDKTKFAVPAAGGAWPLGCIHLLQRSSVGPTIEPLERPEAVHLLGLTFNHSVQTPGRLAHHLDLCSRLAHRVPITRVRITPELSASEVAAFLAAHIHESERVA